MRLSYLRLLFDPAPNEGGSAATPSPTTPIPTASATPSPTTPSPMPSATEAGKGYEALLAENATLKADLQATKAKVPKEGAVVLVGDDAAGWADLIKIGKPAEIRAKVEAGTTAAAEVATFRRNDLYAKAGAIAGFDAEVLADLPGAKDLTIEVREAERNGKKVKVAEVVTKAKDDKGADVERRVDLAKFAEATWPKYLPSLKSGGADVRPSRSGGTPTRPMPVRPATTPTATEPAPIRRRPSF